MNERDIFIAALERASADERSEYLRSACGGDARLRQHIESLLELHEQTSDFLQKPLVDQLAEGVAARQEAVETDRDPITHGGGSREVEFLIPSDQPGSLGRMGQYAITEVIGRGGMGVVLKGHDAKLNRVVAIKVMAPELASNPTARKRFIREAQAAAAVVHQHIVTIHAVDEDRLPYLVMEYIHGQSLQEKIDREGHLKLVEILRIGQQVASGLAAAHGHGLMHRDVKPANILLENGVERVRITDFGLARAVDDVGMTRTGEIAGTPQYMSPEQAQGLSMDGRSDLFSFGCVLYAMCTGRSPFRAETTLATARRICEDTPRDIREINPEIPGWLVEIIGRLLAKSPADRFQTAAEVADLLSQHLAHMQHPSSAPMPVIITTKKKKRGPAKWHLLPQHRLPVALSAAALVCLALTLGLAEATGVTNLGATVIRIFTPNGTLVVETNDPGMKVTIEGDGGLTINGAGLEEIRLKPGSYKVHAAKDGKPVRLDQELVTITRGDKQVVRVRLEAIGLAKATPPLVPRAVLEGHGSWVHSLAFSPDGKTLATGSNDQRVRLWDTATGNLTGQFHADDGMITSLAYSPDGTVLVTASNQCKVRVWDAATFKLLAEAKHDAFVGKVAFRRGDALLATASDDKTVKLWKWDGAVLVPVRTFGEHSSGISTMSFNPQGTVIASATRDGMLYLWDVESGKPLKSVRLGWQMLLGLAFSPDGTTIAAAGLDKRVELRKADTLESVGILQGHKEWVRSLVFLPDGKTLVSAGGGSDQEIQNSKSPGELKLWDTARLKERLSVDGYEKGIRGVALSADGKTLATGDFSNLGRLWDVDALLAAARARETADAGATPERGAFVLLGGKGVAERKFDTLAEAVQHASNGDTIEARGNGPFASEPIHIQRTALTIRAGAGYRPVIQLSPEAAQRDVPLLSSDVALVLEGLELHRTGSDDPAKGRFAMIKALQAPLRAANCRFRATLGANFDCVFRNCEFLEGGVWGQLHSGTQFSFQNCLHGTNGIQMGFYYDDAALHNVSIEIKRGTIVSAYTPLWLGIQRPLPVPSGQSDTSRPIRIEVSESVFDGSPALGFDQRPQFLKTALALQPAEAEAALQRLLQWRGERNLFAAGGAAVTWAVDGKLLQPRASTGLEEWKRLWGAAEIDSAEASIRFHGGNLLSRAGAALDQLTPDDFRLRSDSPGYRAGPDGKDLGANVDLVGPGPAYERWKKTAEYEQWLRDTGQASKAEAAKTEPKAFVVMGGKGVGERKFDTLADAVSRASDGDTIEIRGNGPFLSEPINIQRTALTIRAAEGFRPVIKLTPEAVESELHLISSNGPLVLEGLELHRAPPKDQTSRSAVLMYEAPFWAANCRFRAGVYTDYSDVCILRNCEMVHTGIGGAGGRRRTDARDTFDNCLFATKGSAIGFQIDDAALHNVSIQISRSTFVNSFAPLWLVFQGPTPDSQQPPASEALRLDVSGSVFDVRHVLGFERRYDARDKASAFDPQEEANTLARLVNWRGKGNLFPSGNTSVVWWADGKEQTPRGPKSLNAWRRFWGSAENDSLEGNARFQGGNLVSRLDGDLDQLTPDDFRLRPDSPGYRAGPDRKDLGPDVDLVGPGPAYERWKKTPEYQQWLRDTGQVSKAEAVKAEPKLFVLLGGAGVGERRFATLAEAVSRASNGDTIEIRGDGPFVTEPVEIRAHTLTIRAAAGFRPVIRLSPQGSQGFEPMLSASGEVLVLEGLELQRLDQAEWTPADLVPAIVRARTAAVNIANCRFLLTGARVSAAVWAERPRLCVFRNCELITASTSIGGLQSDARVVLGNCLLAPSGSGIGIHATPELNNISIQLAQCTCTSANTLFYTNVRLPLPSRFGQAPAAKPIRLDVSGTVLVTPRMLGFDQVTPAAAKTGVLEPDEAEATLARLLEWRGERNLFATGSTSIKLAVDRKDQPQRGPKSFEEWKKYWGSVDVDSLEERPRFQGGDLSSRAGASPGQLSAEDFRLRPDSPGYRAGPDGKDLGADVDLVGPGPAYERWKKTPEYQQWLKDTKQTIVEAPKPESKAIVVLTAKGVEIRGVDSLAEAVQGANDGDTIEIRGNGPFVTGPIKIPAIALAIRAGDGYRPVIEAGPNAWDANEWIWAHGPLALEGLTFRGTKTGLQDRSVNAVKVDAYSPLFVTHCRFVFLGSRVNPVHAGRSTNGEVRHCEFVLGRVANQAVVWIPGKDRRLVVHGCTVAGRGLGLDLGYRAAPLESCSIEFTRNAVAGDWSINLARWSDVAAQGRPISLHVADNVFDCPTFMTLSDRPEAPPLAPAAALDFVRELVAYQEGRNVHASSGPLLWYTGKEWTETSSDRTVNDLEAWQQFWGGAAIDSLKGNVRFQGGNLRPRTEESLEALTREDFRLREDSPGYRAGLDGKDLGADVNLVGPGAAYERWKKTPEYQEWLKDTGEMK